MNIRNKFPAIIILGILIFAIIFVVTNPNVSVLHPKGLIALKERNLIVTAILLMLTVVIPIFFFTFFFSWKYRAGNKSTKYAPEWNRSWILQLIWWAIPTVIILTLAIINWKTTHELDPYKPIASTVAPITIQVVALRWKWLFIYPEQNIATINYIQFPEKTPVNFELTANAPMSSFWIPSLGGQMYAMTGMVTKLHLIADSPGKFAGSAAEINGSGFAGMKFVARASSKVDFDAWVRGAKSSPIRLTAGEYEKLKEPSEKNAVTVYSSVDPGLYNGIVKESMGPPNDTTDMKGMGHVY